MVDTALTDMRLRQMNALSAYSKARTALVASMKSVGISEGEIDEYIMASEAMWEPRFGVTSERFAFNDSVRRIDDAARRRGVDPALISGFTAALSDHRSLQDAVHRAELTSYRQGGAEGLAETEVEARRLQLLRDKTVEALLEINPALDVKTAYSVTDGAQGGYDPLRKIATVALDPLGEVEKGAFATAWASIAPALTEKERTLLEKKYSSPEGIAKAFADYAAPGRRRTRKVEHFKSLKTFFEKVKNAAHGEGFQTAKEIFARARSGEMGKREATGLNTTGLRVPGIGRDKGAHDAVVGSIKKMTDLELRSAIGKQEAEIERVGAVRRKGFRRWWMNNRVVQGVSSVANALGGVSVGEKAKAEERQFREMARALRVLRSEASRRRQQALENIKHRLDPTSPLSPSPDRGNQKNLTDQMAERIANANGNIIQFPGRLGGYQVKTSASAEGGLDVTYSNDQGQRVLAWAATPAAAASMVASMQAATAGAVSLMAGKLARAANEAGIEGNADIKAIRASGLIEPQLDRLIGAKDLKCFVYPLKDGSVLWQEGSGRWMAGTRDEFLRQSGSDRTLAAAVDVLQAVTPQERNVPQERTRGVGDISSPVLGGVVASGATLQQKMPDALRGEPRLALDTSSWSQRRDPYANHSIHISSAKLEGETQAIWESLKAQHGDKPVFIRDASGSLTTFGDDAKTLAKSFPDLFSTVDNKVNISLDKETAALRQLAEHGVNLVTADIYANGQVTVRSRSVGHGQATIVHAGIDAPTRNPETIPKVAIPEPEPEPEMVIAEAASFSAGVSQSPEHKPLKLDPALPEGQRKAFVAKLDSPSLIAVYKATTQALARAETPTSGSGETAITLSQKSDLLQLRTAARTLAQAAEARGIDLPRTAEGQGLREQVVEAKKRTKGPSLS